MVERWQQRDGREMGWNERLYIDGRIDNEDEDDSKKLTEVLG